MEVKKIVCDQRWSHNVIEFRLDDGRDVCVTEYVEHFNIRSYEWNLKQLKLSELSQFTELVAEEVLQSDLPLEYREFAREAVIELQAKVIQDLKSRITKRNNLIESLRKALRNK